MVRSSDEKQGAPQKPIGTTRLQSQMPPQTSHRAVEGEDSPASAKASVEANPTKTDSTPSPRTPTKMQQKNGAGTRTESTASVEGEEGRNGIEDDVRDDKSGSEEEEEANDDDDGDDEDEDEEPLLKYTTLTKNQGGLYRNGDAVSTFFVAGDKMIVGTHNGGVHIFALPSFQLLKYYRAHSESVTAISISPYPPPLPAASNSTTGKSKDGSSGVDSSYNGQAGSSPKAKPSDSGKATSQSKGQQQVPNVPSNNIHIATSSLDGHVFIQSLLESREMLRRNFGRPVHTVSLSPDYKNDKTYLSGGTAGSLIRTVGGTIGKTSTSTTVGGASATAQGWLGSVGLGGDEGKDTVLHLGEGKINIIKWSLSGKYVVWVNEQGIKLKRSHLHLDHSTDSDLAWTRMGHIDRPRRQGWEEMAGVWKARVEWVDEDGLETDAEVGVASLHADYGASVQPHKKEKKLDRARIERLLVGWGGSIWVMDVHPGATDHRASQVAKLGKLEVVTILRTDCIISGLSLYTPNLLLVLAYINPEDSSGTPSNGGRRRPNSLPPEIRIIDIRTKEEVALADTLTISRCDTLTSADYHLDTLPAIREGTKVTSSRGALEVMGEFGSNIYGGIWDVALYPKNLLSSGASIISADADKASLKLAASTLAKKLPDHSVNPALLTRGIKIFVHSPFDCVLATKPTVVDHYHWLENHENYEAAWQLLNEKPEAAGAAIVEADASSLPGTPTKVSASLQEFFADDASVVTADTGQGFHSQASKEKRRIGDKWVEQLIEAGDWRKAGQIAGRVVDTAKSWDIWYWRFAKEGKFSEIVDQIPSGRLPHQPLLSATIYEHVLGHYISTNPPRFADLLEKWSTDLFDTKIVIRSIENRLKTGDIREDSVEDGQKGHFWRILYKGLAELYRAAGRYRDALLAYIRLQEADTALSLIKEQHLAHAVADNIPSLILLRVSQDQLANASIEELDEASTEIIQLLIAEAYQGIIPPHTVITQLKSKRPFRPFLFFYFRALWTGLDPDTSRPIVSMPTEDDPNNDILSATFSSSPQMNKFAHVAARSAARELDESRALVNDAADTALPLFASYSRPLFASFLRISNSYTLSAASKLCEEYDYVPELVYLLAKEGRAKRALHLILDRLSDVTQAMAFAREQADPELWDDLVEYSLNRPEFVKVLLEEAGSAGSSASGAGTGIDGSGLDPVGLVRRIPDGMEIEGLKEALGRMLREFELRASISEGVLRVCRGEVAGSMGILRKGQKKGVKFEIRTGVEERPSSRASASSGKKASATTSTVAAATQAVLAATQQQQQEQHHQQQQQQRERRKSMASTRRKKKKRRLPTELVQPGHCAACGELLLEDEPKSLISFPCSHVFHLPCLILYESMPPAQEEEDRTGSRGKQNASGKEASDKGDGRKREAGKKGLAGDSHADASSDDDDDDESDQEASLGLPEPEEEPVAGESGARGAGVGAKVRFAKMIRGRVSGGCPLTLHAAAAS